jgi:hypothetical protein
MGTIFGLSNALRLGTSEDKQLHRGELYHGAILLERSTDDRDDAPIRPRPRWGYGDDFTFHVDRVVGPKWRRPGNLTTRADDAARNRQATFYIQAHRQRRGMPTTGCEAAKECVLGRLFAGVKRLRVELACERLDRLGRYGERCAREALTDRQLVQIQGRRSSLRIHCMSSEERGVEQCSRAYHSSNRQPRKLYHRPIERLCSACCNRASTCPGLERPVVATS